MKTCATCRHYFGGCCSHFANLKTSVDPISGEMKVPFLHSPRELRDSAHACGAAAKWHEPTPTFRDMLGAMFLRFLRFLRG